MLLAIDVGNTNTVLGVFRQEELAARWRLTTARDQTVDESFTQAQEEAQAALNGE